MADLLMAANGDLGKEPKAVLQEAWLCKHKEQMDSGFIYPAFLETNIPPIFVKLMKGGSQPVGLSLNEIVQLGNQVQFSHLSSTAVQNWVKRDVKELIGTPRQGKKYAVEQAATLFIVEDLKASLDFDSIRRILKLVFNNPSDHSDDIVDPLQLYAAYGAIFDELVHLEYENIEKLVQERVRMKLRIFPSLSMENQKMVEHVMATAVFTVFSARYQSLVKKHLTATLFLQGF